MHVTNTRTATGGVFAPPQARTAGRAPAPHTSPHDRGYALDHLERILLLAFFAWMLCRFARAFAEYGCWDSGLLLISEGLATFFVLVRRPAKPMSRSPVAWLVASGATLSVLLVTPGGAALVAPEVGQLLLFTGLIGQLYAKLSLGRSFGMVAAHRGLVRQGPYCLVRHPMYASYLLCHTGFLLLNPLVWNLFIYAFFYTLQIPRLLLEERLLSEDPVYRSYRAAVRYRLIPGVF